MCLCMCVRACACVHHCTPSCKPVFLRGINFHYHCSPFPVSQISYSIGIAEPLAIYIDTYGTGKKSNKELLEIVNKNFDLRPGMIIK